MATTPTNLTVQQFTGNGLETIASPASGQTFTGLWLVVFNPTAANVTIDVFHTGDAVDVQVVTREIAPGTQEVFTELGATVLDAGQFLKVQAGAPGDTYNVDLSATVVTS